MGPDLSATPRTTACPSCGASARPDATFCGQCYADFRPPPPPPVISSVPPPNASYGVPAPDPLTAPLSEMLPVQPTAPGGDAGAASAPPASALAVEATAAQGAAAQAPAEVTWPCTTCGAANPLSAMTCSDCGAGFLAAARTSTTLVLPVVGDIGAMSRGKRVAVAAGAVAALLVPLALLTLLLTKHPPEDTGPSTPLPVTAVTTTP